MRIDELLNNCPVLHVTGDPAVDISSIAYDSRNCTKSSLFVAVQGLKTDGHEYIDQAAARGAIAVVYERDLPLLPAGMTAIRVENSRRALGILGRNYYHDPSSQLFLVGVTGTKGKTTVTYLLESIFQKAGLSAGVLGTVNYRFGGKIMPASNTTPESIEMQKMLRLMVDEGVTHVVAEVSSHAVDLRRIDDCAFDIGVFTNLAQDHLDYHLTLENYYQVKRRFFTEVIPEGGKKQQPQRIINADDAWGKRLIDELDSGSLTYGIDSPCHVRAEKYDLAIDAIRADIASPWGGLHVMSGLTGKFNLYNILAAVASALSFGIEPEAVQEGVKALSSVPGRLEKVKTGIDAEPMVFVDYAHTEDALRKVLESLRHFKEGKIITVFGCGGDRDRGKGPSWVPPSRN
ncbi:MAG: UDP-N-acetylmuramoyl-L-alanyl-D-glutamate--2,6-diaminopimelate ligase [Deltaproteobacteria bacterium]|nr:UDP-N-acetylmuramoyl-L-alanyl-D-glutamate--2,6-diaminopimelate ligase [Deltaproteobacteria bacterium]